MSSLQVSIAFSRAFPGTQPTPVSHTLDLDTPPGTTTGGGKNATQSVTLRVGAASPTIVLGVALGVVLVVTAVTVLALR
jgi:hypothetical protein